MTPDETTKDAALQRALRLMRKHHPELASVPTDTGDITENTFKLFLSSLTWKYLGLNPEDGMLATYNKKHFSMMAPEILKALLVKHMWIEAPIVREKADQIEIYLYGVNERAALLGFTGMQISQITNPRLPSR